MHKLSLILCLLTLSSCKFESYEFWYKDRPDQRFNQVDRVGLPGVSLLVLDEETMTDYNTSDPKDDVEDFREVFIERIAAQRNLVGSIAGFPGFSGSRLSTEAVADELLPDVYSVDLSKTISFEGMNGRRHGDEAMDFMMNMVLGTRNVSSDLSENRNFIGGFPYLQKAYTTSK